MSDAEDSNKQCPLCGETIKLVAVRCKHCHADLAALAAQAAQAAQGTPGAPGSYAKPGTVADFDRGARSGPMADADFERLFLDFAYETHEVITAISVAHALKVPIAFADDRLEYLAASDVILRDVDDEGGIFFTLPGRRRRQMQPLSHGGVPQMMHHPGSGGSSHGNANQGLMAPPGQGSLVPQLLDPMDSMLMPNAPPPTEAAAVTGLVLNLCIPGVGSIVAGKPGPGIAQLAMLVAGLPLCFVLVGFPIVFASWLWALMTAAAALQEARREQQRV